MIGALAGGLGLTVVVTAVLWLVWGEAARIPGVVFGLVATVIQVVSAGLVARVARGDLQVLFRRWGVGMGLRVLGIAIFGLASWRAPGTFPPLPTACAYVGVVIPLLFWELRFLR